MSFVKKHWRFTVPAVVALCVLLLGVFLLYGTSEPPELTRVYAMPESGKRAALDTRIPSVEIADSPTPVVTSIEQADADEGEKQASNLSRAELLAQRDALLAKLQKEKLRTKAIALRRKEFAERQALLDQEATVNELHQWVTTYAAPKWRQIQLDLQDDSRELAAFADIGAHELWQEMIPRLAELSPPLQQMVIDSIRRSVSDDVATFVAREVPLNTGGAQ